MKTPPLPAELTTAVLNHLHLSPAAPDHAFLDALLNAYVRTVPWESAFRIVKREQTAVTADCPRWPAAFWRETMAHGSGGSCFESNYAFFSLLLAVGFDGYLTINDMGETKACHTAIILLLDGQKWLVDAGFPLYAPIPINPEREVEQLSAFMRYTVVPKGNMRYKISRYPHPKTYAFTLIDQPVTDEAYRTAVINDYEPSGFFLDKVIIIKIMDEQLWRFDSAVIPSCFQLLMDGVRVDEIIEGDVKTAVSQKFGIEENTVQHAFDALAETQK